MNWNHVQSRRRGKIQNQTSPDFRFLAEVTDFIDKFDVYFYVIVQAENESPRTERANSTSRSNKSIGGGMDMMAEMQRKLAARCERFNQLLLCNSGRFGGSVICMIVQLQSWRFEFQLWPSYCAVFLSKSFDFHSTSPPRGINGYQCITFS